MPTAAADPSWGREEWDFLKAQDSQFNTTCMRKVCVGFKGSASAASPLVGTPLLVPPKLSMEAMVEQTFVATGSFPIIPAN